MAKPASTLVLKELSNFYVTQKVYMILEYIEICEKTLARLMRSQKGNYYILNVFGGLKNWKDQPVPQFKVSSESLI